MTWGRARRRAEEFEALVAGATAARELPAGRAPEVAPLLELVGALRAVPDVSARPEFVADLRGRLMAAAETELVPADVSRLRLPERRPGRERRLAAVVGGIAIVGASTSVAFASQSALPGDSLYPVKRAIEQAHTGLSLDEGSKGATVLANASDRLDEVDALTRRDGVADDVRVAETLRAFTDQATEASDLLLADYADSGHASSVARLRDFTARSVDRLAALEPLVPADARDELIDATRVLSTIDAEAAQRCPTCGGAGITSIPPVLASAATTVVVPQQPIDTQAVASDGPRHHHPRAADPSGGRHHGPRLPHLDPTDLGPGSLTPAGTGDVTGGVTGDGTPGTGQSAPSDPVGTLTHQLTGGGSGDGGGSTGSDPVGGTVGGAVGGTVGGAVDGVAGGVDGLLHGVTDPLTGQQTPLP